MDKAEAGGAGALRALAAAALALLAFTFTLTPIAERIDGALLDQEWRVLRLLGSRPAPDDIVIVGVDEASVRSTPEPRGVWHIPLGEVLVRIASAHPRAIALDLPLPDRSYDSLRPGLDRALLVGLAAARGNGPFVTALAIDARTRSPRAVFPPYLAVLGEDGLGLDLLPRDADGVTRRFDLLIPTQEGGYPSLTGRLCRKLSRRCDDGLIHFALGPALTGVSFSRIRETRDTAMLEKLFHDRIVLIGDTQRFSDRIAVPWNPAAWDEAADDAPAVAVHALALRTALLDAAPQQASRPLVMLLLSLAAAVLAFPRRPWARVVIASAFAALLVLPIVTLGGGLFLPVAAPLATLAVAAVGRPVLWRWIDRTPALRA